jgi:hypothetical protein
MTSIRAKAIVRFTAAALLALAVSAVTSSASFAFSAEAQQMCTGDAFRLCSSEIPNISKITICMRAQRANLSVGCRAVMDKDDAAARSTVATR